MQMSLNINMPGRLRGSQGTVSDQHFTFERSGPVAVSAEPCDI